MYIEIYSILHLYVTVLMAKLDYTRLVYDYCPSNE